MLKIPNESEYLLLRLKIATLIGYIEGVASLLPDDIKGGLNSRANVVADLMGMTPITQAAKLQGEMPVIPPLETSPELLELIRKSKEAVDKMTPKELREMLRKQGESWAKSEAQWAKDFRDGKCERD